MLGSLVRLTLALAACVPAHAGEQGRLAERLQAMVSQDAVGASTRTPEASWAHAGGYFDGYRDAPSAVAAGGRGAAPSRSADQGRRAPPPLHMSVPPVPKSGPVTLMAEDEDDAKGKKAAPPPPPPDPMRLGVVTAGMLIGALVGFLCGGPIGLCVGLCAGVFIGALAAAMMPKKS